MERVFTTDEAITLAAQLNNDTEDDWTYVAVPFEKRPDLAQIHIFDDIAEYVGTF